MHNLLTLRTQSWLLPCRRILCFSQFVSISKAISQIIEPMLGMFVLISMHFSWQFQIIQNSYIFENIGGIWTCHTRVLILYLVKEFLISDNSKMSMSIFTNYKKPILGMFVLISSHFSWRCQILQWNYIIFIFFVNLVFVKFLTCFLKTPGCSENRTCMLYLTLPTQRADDRSTTVHTIVEHLVVYFETSLTQYFNKHKHV